MIKSICAFAALIAAIFSPSASGQNRAIPAYANGSSPSLQVTRPVGLRPISTSPPVHTPPLVPPVIIYHNGPLMLGTANIYLIFYGAWGPLQQALIETWASNINGSPYFNMDTTYYDRDRRYMSDSFALAGVVNDPYSLGSALTNAQVLQVITNTINAGSLPLDFNGVYFLLTSPDVTEQNFCNSYCGYHVDAMLNGQIIKYVFVGNSETQCASICTPQQVSPNGLPGVDAMIGAATHELAGVMTDPQLNGWFFGNGEESSDMCAWNYGTEHTLGDGAKWNTQLGGKLFLLMEDWVNADGGYCGLSYTTPAEKQ